MKLILILALAIGLIPAPVEYTPSEGTSTVKKVVVKEGRSKFRKEVSALPEFAQKEAYRLTIGPKKVKIEALTPEGVFRAKKTLEQLRLQGEVPCGVIFDYPRFRHRGLMIDESRTFKGLDFLKKQVDAMALLKLNVLHLHLDDSAGWRMEIESRPALTEKTAWRLGADYFGWEGSGYRFATADTPGAYGGYYTKAEMRELVKYAAERFITVIPEIEMPGHSMEVGYAYPEVLCTLDNGKVRTGAWDLCPGSEETFSLLEDILMEVMDVFPSEIIHVGGDEAHMKTWADCPKCRKRIEEEGLEDYRQLQGYLMKRIDKFVRSHGRRIAGWDEILETGVPEQAVVQSWRGIEGGQAATARGHQVIMSPVYFCYLNYYQDLISKEPRGTGELNSLKHCYSFNPAQDIPSEDLVLGLQGNLWCEYVIEPSLAEYMIYPRLFAIAECGWTPLESKDYLRFRADARHLCDVFRAKGYNTFDLDTETERARSGCFEVGTNKGYNYVVQEDGPTLSYGHNSGVRIIVSEGLAFRDMNGNGKLDPFEDWRLSPDERLRNLKAFEGPIFEADLNDTEAFASGHADNPYKVQATWP